MKHIFVDTNAWIALNNINDQWYHQSSKLNKEMLQSGCRYITSNFILDETYTGLLMKVGHFAAVDFGERIRNSRLVQIIPITSDIEKSAWEIFKHYKDKRFSYTDCTSFVIMKNLNLTEAFTNDHHFEQFGFVKILNQV